MQFSLPTGVPNNIFEGNGRAELEQNTFNDDLFCDDEAHIVVLCT